MVKEIFIVRIELHCKQLSWTVQKQPSTAIHFRKFPEKTLVVESFFWSNYRLTVQSSDCILKWLHQELHYYSLPLFKKSEAIKEKKWLAASMVNSRT